MYSPILLLTLHSLSASEKYIACYWVLNVPQLTLCMPLNIRCHFQPHLFTVSFGVIIGVSFITTHILSCTHSIQHLYVITNLSLLPTHAFMVHKNHTHRTSNVGCDLNRVWGNPSPIMHPTIFATKEAITEIASEHVSNTCDSATHLPYQSQCNLCSNLSVYVCMDDCRLW